MLIVWLLAASALFSAAYSAGMRRRWPSRGSWVEVQGARLHVTRRGAGPPVVIVHGMYANAANFPDALIERLATRHTVIVFDRPGHGGSGRLRGARAGLDENVVAARAVAKALNLPAAIVVGHSYGAVVALRWALDAPQEVLAVVALAPVAMPGGALERLRGLVARPAWLTTLLAHTIAVPIGLVVQWGFRHRAWWPMRAPRQGNASRDLAVQPAALIASAAEVAAMHHDLSTLAPRYATFPRPLAVVAAPADRVTPSARHAERLAEVVPGATITRVAGAGHQLQFMAIDDVLAAVAGVADRAGGAGN